MITTLSDRIGTLPEPLRDMCERLFYIEVVRGYTDPPASMAPWIEDQFGSVDAVRQQTITKVMNRFTLEGAIFNPIRARRPMEATRGDAALEARISEELAGRDYFRAPLRDTTADLFGRIRGRHCITASNVAKCDGWHGLVLFDEPHPLRFGRDQLRDYIDVALRWFAAAHAHDAAALYPMIFWHCLPKGSASQMHGHMQIALGRGMHYARVELWRRAAMAYQGQYRAPYFDDLVAVHHALGLTLPAADGVRSFVHLTPLREREIVLLADHAANVRFADALYAMLRGLIDGLGMRAFNVAIALPPLGPTAEDWSTLPVIARIADRGNPLSTRSDIGAMELYAMGCIVSDPFDVAAYFRGAGG